MNLFERYGKPEQIAIYCPNIPLYKFELQKQFGLTDWIDDTVTADGFVFGEPIEGSSVGDLAFNYSFGYEFELLTYKSGNNWHKARGKDLSKPFLSHKGWHVKDMREEIKFMDSLGIGIAQELVTKNHTNPYLIEKGRRYHYCVFNTEEIFGFDVKLIQRIEANG